MGLFLRNMHHTNKIISYSILSLAQQRLRCIYTLSNYGSRTAHKYRYWHVLDHNRRQNSRGQVVHKKLKSWHAYQSNRAQKTGDGKGEAAFCLQLTAITHCSYTMAMLSWNLYKSALSVKKHIMQYRLYVKGMQRLCFHLLCGSLWRFFFSSFLRERQRQIKCETYSLQLH